MYAACGAVSKADHEKVQADLDAATTEKKDTEAELKKEAKSKKDAEKKVEDIRSEVEDLKKEKEAAIEEKNKTSKDAEKKAADLAKAQKELKQVKADMEKEKEAAADALRQLAEIKDRATKAEELLQQKEEEAKRLEEERQKELEEAAAKLEEVTEKEEALEEEKKEEVIKKTKGKVWKTGLCSCCAKPGGIGLCLKGFCCPCIVIGNLNAKLKEDGTAPCPGGCCGGCCLGCCCEPCYMCKAGPTVANKRGTEEGKCKACCCGLCCPCCYITQVYRENLIVAEEGGVSEAPAQETMGKKPSTGSKKERSGDGKWSTGLCSCCAKPGGVVLCCKACCCPCLVAGNLNAYMKEQNAPGCPGGCCGGCCLGCCCFPCFMRKAGPVVGALGDIQEGKCKACMKGCCCPCCYLEQVYRESLLLKDE